MAKLERFERDGKYGYKDENGKVVIKPIYNDGPICFGTESNHNNKFACVAKGTLWGVINEQGEKIVNFLYDDVRCIQNKIVVAREGKIGILDENGRIIINPSYQTIECVSVSYDDNYNGLYGIYGEHCVFDSNTEHSKLFRKKIRYSNSLKFDAPESSYDFNRYFILSNNGYSELFSVESGIITNSRFATIEPLSNASFFVKQNDKWGIYRADESKIIIECIYDRIVFKGGVVVLLQKDGLWGAKTYFTSIFHYDVPIKFKEIKIIVGDGETLFGVKNERKNYKGDVVEEFTIVDENGEYFKEMSRFEGLDKQCEIFDSNYDRILASKDNKYGFISADGYVSIPFQYDSVTRRKDGWFDVKIGNAWGVIDISGKEIVAIKYAEKLPTTLSNAIVQNTFTSRYGVLSENGSEKVPSIYEHLQLEKNLILFGYDNGRDDCCGESNFFSEVGGAIWGVMDETGKTIINSKYDCFKFKDGFILAGRNGTMLHCNNDRDNYCSEYSGVYDLYAPDGDLIFGGFSDFFYNKENELYAFFLGGEWEYCAVYCEEITIYDYELKRETGNWLFLDKNLRSIIKDKNGECVAFNKGVIYESDTSNIPSEIMIHRYHKIVDCNIIVGADDYDEDGELYPVYAVINIKTGQQSDFYPYLKYAGNSMFFFAGFAEEGDFPINDFGDKLGILNAEEIIAPNEYLFFTFPVNGFFFGAIRDILYGHYTLQLFSLRDETFCLTAIEEIEIEKLIDYTIRGSFKIELDGNGVDVKNIILPKLELFDESFAKCVSKKESHYWCPAFKNVYWYSTDYIMSKENYDAGFDYNDN